MHTEVKAYKNERPFPPSADRLAVPQGLRQLFPFLSVCGWWWAGKGSPHVGASGPFQLSPQHPSVMFLCPLVVGEDCRRGTLPRGTLRPRRLLCSWLLTFSPLQPGWEGFEQGPEGSGLGWGWGTQVGAGRAPGGVD